MSERPMIKVYEWSHTAGSWIYHASFESVEEAEIYISDHDYNPRFFRAADEMDRRAWMAA